MKTLRLSSIFTVICLFFSACSSSDDGSDPLPLPPPDPVIAVGDDIAQFDVNFNMEPLTESENIPSSSADAFYADYFEHKTFSKSISVVFDGDIATITEDGAQKSVSSKLTLTPGAAVEYVLSGKSADGFFKIASNAYDVKISLAALDLTNPSGTAINVQSKSRTFLHIADGTSNSLTDGNNYPTSTTEDMKGTVFTEGRLIVSGKGYLDIFANAKNAIASDSYILFRPGHVINISNSASNGIKAKDAVYINGGVLNIDVSANTAKGINSEGSITVNGGRTTIIAAGESEYNGIDLSNSAAIKCDLNFIQNAGSIALKTTGNGAKALNCNQNITINDGELLALVSGGKYVYNTTLSANSKGINADAAVTVAGGTVRVIVSNIVSGEAIESKTDIALKGGLIELSSKDDCLKALRNISISGGKLYAYSHNADGLDCTGSVNISGGISVITGEVENDGIDCDQNEFTISGGTLVAIGTTNSAVTSATQKYFVYDKPITAGTVISLADAASSDSNAFILRYKAPRDYSPCSIILSSPAMDSASGAFLASEVSVANPDGIFHGLAH